MEPEYEGAAQSLKSHGVILAKINGIEEKELTDANGVHGYPTLMVCNYYP